MGYPDTWGLKYTEVQGLVWLAYKANGSKGAYSFTNSDSTWTITDVIEKGSFRAVLVSSGGKRILSFSGTDDKGDWVDNVGQGLTGVSPQYELALKVANSTSPDVVVGHSLGGGLASYVAIYQGRRAATINPAPLNMNIFSAVAVLRHHGLVVNYVVPGEVLELLDVATGARMEKVGRVIYVQSKGGLNPIQRHFIDTLSGFVKPTRLEGSKLKPLTSITGKAAHSIDVKPFNSVKHN